MEQITVRMSTSATRNFISVVSYCPVDQMRSVLDQLEPIVGNVCGMHETQYEVKSRPTGSAIDWHRDLPTLSWKGSQLAVFGKCIFNLPCPCVFHVINW